MMGRVAISIGIANTEGLVALPGAVQGARDFADWARTAGFDVYEFIDADHGPVHVRHSAGRTRSRSSP